MLGVRFVQWKTWCWRGKTGGGLGDLRCVHLCRVSRKVASQVISGLKEGAFLPL